MTTPDSCCKFIFVTYASPPQAFPGRVSLSAFPCDYYYRFCLINNALDITLVDPGSSGVSVCLSAVHWMYRQTGFPYLQVGGFVNLKV